MLHKSTYFLSPKKIVESYRPFPFKGKARMGMGSFAGGTPSPPQPSP